jgi:hypothetical protein
MFPELEGTVPIDWALSIDKLGSLVGLTTFTSTLCESVHPDPEVMTIEHGGLLLTSVVHEAEAMLTVGIVTCRFVVARP